MEAVLPRHPFKDVSNTMGDVAAASTLSPPQKSSNYLATTEAAGCDLPTPPREALTEGASASNTGDVFASVDEDDEVLFRIPVRPASLGGGHLSNSQIKTSRMIQAEAEAKKAEAEAAAAAAADSVEISTEDMTENSKTISEEEEEIQTTTTTTNNNSSPPSVSASAPTTVETDGASTVDDGDIHSEVSSLVGKRLSYGVDSNCSASPATAAVASLEDDVASLGSVRGISTLSCDVENVAVEERGEEEEKVAVTATTTPSPTVAVPPAPAANTSSPVRSASSAPVPATVVVASPSRLKPPSPRMIPHATSPSPSPSGRQLFVPSSSSSSSATPSPAVAVATSSQQPVVLPPPSPNAAAGGSSTPQHSPSMLPRVRMPSPALIRRSLGGEGGANSPTKMLDQQQQQQQEATTVSASPSPVRGETAVTTNSSPPSVNAASSIVVSQQNPLRVRASTIATTTPASVVAVAPAVAAAPPVVVPSSAPTPAAAAAPAAPANGAVYSFEDVERISRFQIDAIQRKADAEKEEILRQLSDTRHELAKHERETVSLRDALSKFEATLVEMTSLIEEERSKNVKLSQANLELEQYSSEVENAFNDLHSRYTQLKEFCQQGEAKQRALHEQIAKIEDMRRMTEERLVQKETEAQRKEQHLNLQLREVEKTAMDATKIAEEVSEQLRLKELQCAKIGREKEIADADVLRANAVSESLRVEMAESKILFDRQAQKTADLEAQLKREIALRQEMERNYVESREELDRMARKMEERQQNPIEQEVVTLKALLSRAEVEKKALVRSLEAKTAENADLARICDELLQVKEGAMK